MPKISIDSQITSVFFDFSVCGFIWIAGSVAAIPAAMFTELHENVIACISNYSESFMSRYYYFLFATTYCIPGVIIAFFYSIIAIKTDNILTLTANSSIHQRKIFRMIAALVALFWIFHLPFWVCLFRSVILIKKITFVKSSSTI